ncbi:MAG: substrate-binding domain-containing protein [Acidobacteria bacterium]|jgi:D-xylose transport system substrate-binding protein|nr:substrate-binding domain-containing protein [Acidobacteriota bacterium]
MKNWTKGIILLIYSVVFFTACVNAPQETVDRTAANAPANIDPNKKIKIGFAMDTLKEERWVRDKEAFEARCKELNVECVVTVADNKSDKQANDVDNLLTQNVDVLVIAPHDATQAASMVEKAKAQGVPVISYDRLINSDKIDLYVSHQVPVIGRKIAEYALQKVPKGNYVMVYGASTDNNAAIMKKEQLAVLQPAIDRGDIKIVADQFITDWKPVEALNFVENALTQNNDNIQAVVVSNDGMAGGAISALEKRGLTGKVLVTGQDAQKDALQRIAQGKQTMTVYKPIIPLANAAVEAAIKLAKKESLSDAKPFKNDALGKDVPAILLEVQVVDKNNLMQTVIKDGYATFEDVYANVPPDQRPKQ